MANTIIGSSIIIDGEITACLTGRVAIFTFFSTNSEAYVW